MDMLIISTSCDHDYNCYYYVKKKKLLFMTSKQWQSRDTERREDENITDSDKGSAVLLWTSWNVEISLYIVWLHIFLFPFTAQIHIIFFCVLLIHLNKLSQQQKKMKGFSFRFYIHAVKNYSLKPVHLLTIFFCIHGESCSFSSSYHHHFNNN